ncbi:TetR/AcrR family transcriptional regulator [Microbacterium sp. NPDC078814]|uniref:TetR/AcrR family transcriptional regulator n=1 Tax=Microbacterium sp. NPDC078814 TaxID=3154767 RepID=UPI000DB75BA3|nr:MAG: TetR family transcriptional regulator [Gordonia sp. (in: high G+C Gram-positive bacteria)]
MARTKTDLLDDAIDVLRTGGTLTIESLAQRAGLTKPGVLHHFPSKEALMEGLIERVGMLWEQELVSVTTAEESDPLARFRAYVTRSLTQDFDGADLALIGDVRLRAQLCQQWTERLDPWFGNEIPATPSQRALLHAARFLADGAWFDQGLGIAAMSSDERSAVKDVALELIDRATT